MRRTELHRGLNLGDAQNLRDLWQCAPSPRSIITSPPYLDMHDYGNASQIGFRGQSVRNYLEQMARPRGLLMLRLASASTAALLKAAEVSRSDLEFWWSPLGTDLGLWDSPSDIELFSDLWADVEAAKDTAAANISNLGGTSSIRDVANILTRDMSLTQFSRAPMWLLGLK